MKLSLIRLSTLKVVLRFDTLPTQRCLPVDLSNVTLAPNVPAIWGRPGHVFRIAPEQIQIFTKRSLPGQSREEKGQREGEQRDHRRDLKSALVARREGRLLRDDVHS